MDSTQLSFAFAAEVSWSEINTLSIDDLNVGEMKAVCPQAIGSKIAKIKSFRFCLFRLLVFVDKEAKKGRFQQGRALRTRERV